MSMTIPEARAELKQLFDQCFTIMAKTGGRITDETSNEDRTQLEQNKANILGLEIKLQGLLDADADSDFFAKGRESYGRPSEPHRQPANDPRGGYARSIGAGVIASDDYRAAKASGQLNQSLPQLHISVPDGVSLANAAKSAGLEQKALLTSSDTSAGGFVINDRLPGWTGLTRGELAFLDLLPTQSTTSDVVEYVVQTTRTNAAAPVAEATLSTGASGAKPESALAWSVVTAPVQQVATHIPATTRILNDLGMLRAAIDDDLLYMLRETLEQQCVIGTGTPPQLTGINVAAGTQTLAAVAGAPIDAIFNASLACRFTGGVAATAAIVGAATWGALRLARENAASGTLGNYLLGPPNMPGPITIFGLTVAVATAMPANTAFVLNLTPTTIALIEREGGTIETGWINDQFTRNILTIRAELRGVLAIRRPLGIVKVTGMP